MFAKLTRRTAIPKSWWECELCEADAKGGLCALCGIESNDGLYWRCSPIVLDFGMPGMDPMEPDMTTPTSCDSCELLHQVCSAYRYDPIAAQRMYGATSAANALRLMGWKAHPELTRALARQRMSANAGGQNP